MKPTAVFLVMLFFVTMAFVTPVNDAAASNASWTAGTPTVLQRIQLPAILNTDCFGYAQNLYVSELKTSHKACVYGDERLRVGYFSSGGPYVGVVGFPYTNELHVLEGVCNGIECRYSADQDMIVTQTQTSQFGWSIVVYLHVSERIKQIQVGNETLRYVFDPDHPDYIAKDETGKNLWTPRYGVSTNGKWLVVELRDKGIAIINTHTFEGRQITTEGNRYGFGLDPNEELAVSNDGKSVVVTGVNAGFAVLDVTEGCGQSLSGDLTLQPGRVNCPSSELGISDLFPSFYYAELPKFYGDGHQLGVSVRSLYEGSTNIMLLAHGSTPVHKLRMLTMGDSFTSGEGETDAHYYQPGTDDEFDTCHVSKRAYPFLVAVGVGVATSDVKSVACSGATIGDIAGSKGQYWGQGDRLGSKGLKLPFPAKELAQEEALGNFQPGRALQSQFLERYTPDVLMIGIGGNDAGLMGKLRTCAMPGTCEWAEGEGIHATAKEIRRLADRLGALFSQIAENYPGTRVFVVGYPDIIEVDGDCDATTNTLLDETERLFIKNSLHYLNQVIRGSARRAGFGYLDIENSMAGRKLCGGSHDGAMNGLRFGDDIAVISVLPMVKIVGAETFHPTPLGHALIADTILANPLDLLPNVACLADSIRCDVSDEEFKAPEYWGDVNETDTIPHMTDFAAFSTDSPLKLTVTLPDGVLQPSSSAELEIHSDMTHLGTVMADDKGGVLASVAFPLDFPEGFHTLHLFGMNREGAPVDIYQFVSVQRSDLGVMVSVGNGDVATSKVNITKQVPPPATSVIDIPGVLGVQSVSSIPSNVAPIVSKFLTTAKNIGVLPVVAIGGVVAILATLATILARRKWAKPAS